MKNNLKGIFLTVLMLFATLYPCGQSYANGLPSKTMTISQRKVLVEQLSKDNEFKILFKKSIVFGLQLYKGMSETKPNENLNEFKFKDLNDVDKIKFFQTSGISNESEFNSKTLELQQLLQIVFSNHAELNSMSKDDLQKVFMDYATNVNSTIEECLIIFASVLGAVVSAAILWTFLVGLMTATVICFQSKNGSYFNMQADSDGNIQEGTFRDILTATLLSQASRIGVTFDRSVVVVNIAIIELVRCVGVNIYTNLTSVTNVTTTTNNLRKRY